MKVSLIRNERLELAYAPEFGCHWLFLQYKHKGEWLDLLYRVPNVDELPTFCTRDGSYILAPWSNRLVGAQFQFQGEQYKLRTNFPDGTAIHGDVWTRSWEIVQETPDSFEAHLSTANFKDFNYPFRLSFVLKIKLKDNQVQTSFMMKNEDKSPAPVGFGFHPFWKRRLTSSGSDAHLEIPADFIYPTKEAVPTGPAQPVSGKMDLRPGADLSGMSLDDCYTGLTQQEIVLKYDNPGIKIKYQFDPIFSHVVVYSPLNKFGQPDEFVAVEPVTNATDGFNLLEKGWSNTGVKILKPEEEWGGRWIVSVEGA